MDAGEQNVAWDVLCFVELLLLKQEMVEELKVASIISREVPSYGRWWQFGSGCCIDDHCDHCDTALQSAMVALGF